MLFHLWKYERGRLMSGYYEPERYDPIKVFKFGDCFWSLICLRWLHLRFVWEFIWLERIDHETITHRTQRDNHLHYPIREFPRNVKTYNELLKQYGSINESHLKTVLQTMVDQDVLIHDTQYMTYKVRAKAPEAFAESITVPRHFFCNCVGMNQVKFHGLIHRAKKWYICIYAFDIMINPVSVVWILLWTHAWLGGFNASYTHLVYFLNFQTPIALYPIQYLS